MDAIVQRCSRSDAWTFSERDRSSPRGKCMYFFIYPPYRFHSHSLSLRTTFHNNSQRNGKRYSTMHPTNPTDSRWEAKQKAIKTNRKWDSTFCLLLLSILLKNPNGWSNKSNNTNSNNPPSLRTSSSYSYSLIVHQQFYPLSSSSYMIYIIFSIRTL